MRGQAVYMHVWGQMDEAGRERERRMVASRLGSRHHRVSPSTPPNALQTRGDKRQRAERLTSWGGPHVSSHGARGPFYTGTNTFMSALPS